MNKLIFIPAVFTLIFNASVENKKHGCDSDADHVGRNTIQNQGRRWYVIRWIIIISVCPIMRTTEK